MKGQTISGESVKIRIDWCIDNRKGCGGWHDLEDIAILEHTVVNMNKKYGSGTHWITHSNQGE